MEENIRKKYDRIAKITGILVGIILVLGTSYAVFRTVTRGEQENVISAGKLDVRIENEQDEINLENAFPITEEEGKKQTPYTFDIVNEGTINAEYDLYIEIDESVSTLPTEVVRYYLTVEEDGTEKIVTSASRILSQEEMIEKEGKKLYKLDNKYLDAEKTNHYKLYLWVDYDATTEQAINKTFEAKVSIEAVQIYDENRLVQQIDVSEAGDGSVTAYMYANGNVVIKGQGNIKNDLSDTLVYANEEFLNIYKKVFIAAGAPEEDVKSFTSLQEFENYLMRLQQEDPELYQSIISQNMNTLVSLVIIQDVLRELGYDTNGIELTLDAYMTYLIEQGLMNESGQPTDEGQEFYTKVEEKTNSLNSPTIPAKSIVLENGITNIPQGLFTGNEDITEVRIPDSVTTIADRAFYGCTGLKEIVLSNNIESMGGSAFENCISLEKVNIPSKITAISGSAFRNCTSLTSIIIPETVTSIENSAFYNCTGLTYLSIPGTILISSNMFNNVNNLETVEITGSGDMPDYSSTTYKYTPWYTSREKLTALTISDKITHIGDYQFKDCNKVTKLSVPGTATSNMTTSISGVKELTITGSGPMVDYGIGSSGFYSNTMWSRSSHVTELVISDKLTSIGSYAFVKMYDIEEIILPKSIKTIGISAFAYCTSLTSIDLSENIENINNLAFMYCDHLEQINVSKDNSIYTSIDGVLYNKEVSQLIICPSAKTSINIPDSVIIIGDHAFYICNQLTSITIPESVTTIGQSAFADCTSLVSMELPNSVTTMGSSVFSGCSSLQSIVLSSSLTTIESYTFNRCVKLTSIPIPESVTTIGQSAFADCTSLESVNIPSEVISIGSSAFYNCTSVTEVIIPAGVTNIGFNVFSSWTSSQTINIDNTKSYVDENWDSRWNSNCSATINYLRT